jgi:hypothetical protein
MIRNIFIATLALACFKAFPQGMRPASLNLLGGANFSSFVYTGASNTNIDLGYTAGPQGSVNFQLESGRHIFRPEIGFRRMGATATMGTSPVSWKLRYADFSLAYLVSAIKTPSFTLSPGIAYGLSYMTEGEQLIGPNRYTSSSPGFLKRGDMNAQFLTQARWMLTEQVHFMLEYRFGLSLLSIEDNQHPQTTRNISQSLLLGIGFNISKPKTTDKPASPASSSSL